MSSLAPHHMLGLQRVIPLCLMSARISMEKGWLKDTRSELVLVLLLGILGHWTVAHSRCSPVWVPPFRICTAQTSNEVKWSHHSPLMSSFSQTLQSLSPLRYNAYRVAI